MILMRPVVAVMKFTCSRNTATGDNSMICMIPDPFPSSAFGKGSTTPDYSPSLLRQGEVTPIDSVLTPAMAVKKFDLELWPRPLDRHSNSPLTLDRTCSTRCGIVL